MNELLRCSMQPMRCIRTLGAAGLVLALAACAHNGLDDVKPTDTTAYHSAAPAALQPSPAASPTPARE